MSKKNSFDDTLLQIDYELNIEYHGNYKFFFEHEEIHQEKQDIHINDLDSQYLENFTIQDDSEFMLYQVEEDDSFFGLELKFNVSAEKLMNLNNISEHSLFKGMTLKIPKTLQLNVQQKVSQTIQEDDQKTEFQAGFIKYFDIFYINSAGCIKGQLTVHDDVLFFDPAFENSINERIVLEQKLKSVQQLQFQLLLKNVVRVMKREFPSCIRLGGTEIIKTKFIEIHLQTKRSKVVLIQPANENQFLELMESINTVYASYFPPTPSQIVETPTKPQLKTILPFYYLNDLKLEDNIQLAFQKIMGSDIFISYLESKSELINQDIFMKVACYFPSIFKSQSWIKLYSSTTNGSSIKTLMRNTAHSEPVVLFVKDLDKWLFGAYLSEGIHRSQDHFYGTGESFLFTFQNKTEIIVYNWINQNNYITLCDEQGLAIGCGDKYGLYIDSEISNGYSHYCETFGNDILSNKENFIIDRIEIWGLQQI